MEYRNPLLTVDIIATAKGVPHARDDAKKAGILTADTLSSPIVIDHNQILTDYFAYKKGGARDKVFDINTAKDPQDEGRPLKATEPAVQ